MVFIVLLRKANDNLTHFETFHCLTRLWKILRHPKRTDCFIKGRMINKEKFGHTRAGKEHRAS